ncbi:MAG: Na/Pi symporter [Bacteroidia bacterium]
MSNNGQNPLPQSAFKGTDLVYKIGQLIFTLFVFLVALDLMSGSFKLFGADYAKELVTIAGNPFIALFVGMLATAVIQSSSTTTTMIVGLVAAGTMSPIEATPMIMGANIGTSVTSTIVSLGHIGNRSEYQKAIAAATVHDFFNIITVIILFALEYFTGALSSAATSLADMFFTEAGEGGKTKGILDYTTKALAKWILGFTATDAFPKGTPFVSLPIALGLLFLSLRSLTKLLKTFIIGKVQENLDRFIFGSPTKSLTAGFLLTTAVQSSSVTSSLIVPLVASEKVTLYKAFPFLMGANIGTTTTALIAALFLGVGSPNALAIAFVHLLFNLFGVFILFPIPQIRRLPITLAQGLGKLTLRNRIYGVLYVVAVFFLLPGMFIFITQL